MSRLYVRLIVLVYLLFSYNTFSGWWYSIVGTILIVLLARKCWPNEYLEWIGLRISSKEIVLSLLLLAVITFGSFKLIMLIATSAGVLIRIVSVTIFIHIIGYTLNEEIVLGAILLKYLQKRYKKLKRFLISVLVAIVFSSLHYIFYRWIFLEKGELNFAALISIFAVGVIRNNFILGSGHIGYSWALHAGWIFIMFGFAHAQVLTGKELSEPDRFNLYLGSLITIPVLLIIVFFSFLPFMIKDKRR